MDTVLTVCIAKDRVNKTVSPIQLQRLQTFHLLLGGLHHHSLIRFIVVQHHRVDAEDNTLRLLHRWSPHRQPPESFSRKPHPYD